MTLRDLDANVKIEALELLWSLGFYVRSEVLLAESSYSPNQPRRRYSEVTDLDVLGSRFDPILGQTSVVIDCGSGSRRAPLERAFWLRGIAEAVGIDRSVCVVGKKVREDHRRAARRFGVILIEKNAFSGWSKAVGKRSLPFFEDYYTFSIGWRRFLSDAAPTIHDYHVKDYWLREWDRVPVQIPSQIRRLTGLFEPENRLHVFGLIELVLNVVVGAVRHALYISDVGPDDQLNTVRHLAMGGDSQAALVDRLLQIIWSLEKGDRERQQEGSLFDVSRYDVPFIREYADVVSRLAARPEIACKLPRLLQAIQVERMSGGGVRAASLLPEGIETLTEKLLMDVITYCKLASGLNGPMFESLQPRSL